MYFYGVYRSIYQYQMTLIGAEIVNHFLLLQQFFAKGSSINYVVSAVQGRGGTPKDNLLSTKTQFSTKDNKWVARESKNADFETT